jgi:hypothetical protein
MIEISPSRVFVALTTFVIALAILSVSGHGLQYFYGNDRFTEYVRVFNISGEANVAAWFASFSLAICAALLLGIALIKRKVGGPYVGHWAVLALGFLYISIDETAQIHEILIDPLQATFNTSGFFLDAWVIPAIFVVLVLAAAYTRFLLHLPPRTRNLFVLAAALFLGGALGLEMLSAYVYDNMVDQIILRGALATMEDFLENMGVIVFIYALMSYFATQIQDTKIKWRT